MAGDPQQALATAMADIATALQQLQQLQAANVAAAPPQVAPAAEGGSGGGSVIHALFDDSTPFNMASRAGSTAMQDASAILDDTWDGTVSAMPAFITSLKKRSQMAKWNAPDPNRILTYSINNVDHSLLSDFHDIPLSDLEAARIARTDPRAIQNSRAMYYCLSKSLDGDLKTILFDQESNVPTNEDGPTLFKRMMDLTIAASTQISLQALRELQDLDPSAFNYNIPLVNTRATQLFTLATTGSGKLADGERVQLMLTTYDRIKQPVAWSTWVANKTEAFDER